MGRCTLNNVARWLNNEVVPSHAGTLSSLPLYPTTMSAKVKVKPRIRQALGILGFRQDCLGQRPTDCWQHVRASPFCSRSVTQNLEYNPQGPCTLSFWATGRSASHQLMGKLQTVSRKTQKVMKMTMPHHFLCSLLWGERAGIQLGGLKEHRMC